MDKNFISIDDLVRQRLGGGEEQERSGAWLQMRDLLDKEMPQEKRAGFFYWRRMLSAVAVLLVIASISVGGYELSANRSISANASTNTSTGVALPAASAQTTSNTPVKNEVTDAQVTATGIAGNDQPKNNDHSNKQPLIAANISQPKNNQHKRSVVNTATKNTTTENTATATEVANDKLPVASSSATNSNEVIDVPVGKSTPAKNTAHKQKVVNKDVATATTAKAATHNNKAATSAPAHNDDAAASVTTEPATPTATGDNKPAAKTATHAAIKAKTHTGPVIKNTDNKTASASNETAVPVPTANKVTKAKVASVNKTTAPTVTKVNKIKETKVASVIKTTTPVGTAANKTKENKVPSVGEVSAPATATNNKAKENKAKTQKMEALALSSSLTSAASPKINKAAKTAVPSAVTTLANNKVVATNTAIPSGKKNTTASVTGTNKTTTAKIAAAKTGTTVTENVTTTPQPVTGTAVVASAPKPAEAPKPMSAADNTALKNTYAINAKKGKKVMQKLVLYDHHFKTEPGDQHNLDTISIETLTQELGSTAGNSPYVPGAKIVARETPAGSTTATAKGNNSNGANGNEVASTSGAVNQQILPGATASASSKPAMGTAAKQSSGASAMENLSATFNDIKYKVKGVQFAPGLTAGINGTFFGPSSFKGFDFGITGDFIFGNDWSFCTELKYFHRVNSNYTLEDDYYTYTGPQNGPYTKQQVTKTYSFSTLHSLEMPLIVRYTAGKFNLYVGGNIVYSFAINEGDGMPQITATTTTTPVMGNDNKAKLDASDFNSRFGVGCLFGVSYKIAPNVSLDIRNVQTLWDNANSDGSKYVSQQLYKSPSLQLSLSYRLGNKGK